MFNFFKDIADKSSCRFSGVCSVHPTLSAQYDILISQIREISFYLVKMREFGFTNKSAMNSAILGLSLFFINTNINNSQYLNIVQKLSTLKEEIKEKYKEYCALQQLPCEIINSSFDIKDTTTVVELIKYAENNATNKQKAIDKTKQKLYELITIFAKICALNIVKIKRHNPDFDKLDYEVLRFFALTNSYSIREEKIKRRIKEFSHLALEIREKMLNLAQEKYGKMQSTSVTIGEYKGRGVLVSGDDLIELEYVLKEAESLQEDINIYTNGPLFLAHFFPYFKNNKYLKGHWGSDNSQFDFSTFKGSILITRNFMQKIDSLYKGEVFSNKIISFSNMKDIKNDDYKPLLEAAMNSEGFSETKIDKIYNIKYDENKIENLTRDFLEDEIVIVAGNMEDEEILFEYKNKKVLNLNCPLDNEILFKTIQNLSSKNIKINVFFPQYSLENLFSILILLGYKNVKIFISNYTNILINPHVIEALCENFEVKTI